MSAARQFFADIAAARRRRAADNTEDDTTCQECQGTGLADGPDGPPCDYCGGSGLW